MNFSEYLRTVKIEPISTETLDLNQVYCQYNPDRFEDYSLAVGCIDGNILALKSSPHYRYILGDFAPYIEMQCLYGRSDAWLHAKLLRFNALMVDIEKNGLKELPIVLERPIVVNKYNCKYEIYEGHHRLAICLALGITPQVQLSRARHASKELDIQTYR